ncbi:putative fatty acid synthase beta subunit [Talaromyces proteolyticus]|uniref:Fatty acid synthase beta subunit n=1 Tax=Talaromyces proteolyticus TaxID=1131652 RepID=A0AAD4PYC4_9EURO|nr:putative fatty acid synthase beta subunit [Talaromyces proteolyticus]KAH8693926.1 putative fatty acid synthase beta subunit [Talaromyces proteolyticus]
MSTFRDLGPGLNGLLLDMAHVKHTPSSSALSDYTWTSSVDGMGSPDLQGLMADTPMTEFDDRFYGARINQSARNSKNDANLAAVLKKASSPDIDLVSRVEALSSYMQRTLNQGHPSDNWYSLRKCIEHFNQFILCQEDIHALLASLELDRERKLEILHAYYSVSSMVDWTPGPVGSALLGEASAKRAKIICVFGGQGVESYLRELRETYDTYQPLVQTFITHLSDHLQMLASDIRTKSLYPHGLDVQSWLEKPDTTPDFDYIMSAPVSMPLIGLTQIVHYFIACKVFSMSPGDLRQHFIGAAGHSQGIAVAALLSTASTWGSLDTAARAALTVLFWIGFRSQQYFPQSSTPPGSAGEDTDKISPMLSIKGLAKKQVERLINELNAYLPSSQQMHLALVNSSRHIVVGGRPLSLYALKKALASSYPSATDQQVTRVPFSQRKPVVNTRFLACSVPFHTPLLEGAEKQIQEDVSRLIFKGSDIPFPIFRTDNHADLRHSENLIPALVRMITLETVNWEGSLDFPTITHVVDFGPGRESGMGAFVNTLKAGTGVRTIIPNVLQGPSKVLGYASEFYSRKKDVLYTQNWKDQFAPRLIRTANGTTTVDTKFSRLLGLPPVMVAGMTPTTSSWDFVAAVMNAGFHIEFAAGGHHNAASMKDALMKLVEKIPAGRGITCNIIYANPRAMGWQIPLLAELRKSGIPIESLTIGAGVPSIDIANGYIKDLGLKYISFKPGSKDAIDGVLQIAGANPSFPIILQWTGGRGGGHHSFEDFHEPIVEKYKQIRSHQNIVLVAGSGFGGPDDTYPYLTGSWATKLGYPAMPFDGILLGSRVMASKEAHTSPAAKQAIVEALGVDDADWEGTYKRPTGGIVTVKSEMGEPIHKIATRGVLLWSELDQKVFSLPATKQLQELEKQKDYIISRLNKDFQKVWFGKSATGEPVDINEMTYAQVLRRIVDILYVKNNNNSGTWIDPSYKKFFGDVVRCVEETLGSRTRKDAYLQTAFQLDGAFDFLNGFFALYPEAEKDVITAHDTNAFTHLYGRPGQKPLPFIIALDNTFEYWFKKDSLWQSENLEAVFEQDVGRVCILHGPVAAQYTKVIDEPAGEILGNMHESYVQRILKDRYAEKHSNVPEVSYLYRNSMALPADKENLPGVFMQRCDEPPMLIFRLDDSSNTLPEPEQWTSLLGGDQPSWRQALLTLDDVVQGKMQVPNPVKRMCAPRPGLSVQIIKPENPKETSIILKQKSRAADCDTAWVEIKLVSPQEIMVTLLEPHVPWRKSEALTFNFAYKIGSGVNPIQEITQDRESRIMEFYRRIWIGEEGSQPKKAAEKTRHRFMATRKNIIDFNQSIENKNAAYQWKTDMPLLAPLDFSIVIAWKSLMGCLFSNSIGGDFLKLLHLSNKFEVLNNATSVREGDVLYTTSEIKSIKIKKDSGKLVEAHATIHRDQKPIIVVKSEFIIQGSFEDYENTFEVIEEQPYQIRLGTLKDVAVLKSRKWIRLYPGLDLRQYIGRNLVFRLQSRYTFKDSVSLGRIETTGEIRAALDTSEAVIGSVHLNTSAYATNPVISYLSRHSTETESVSHLPAPIALCPELSIRAPELSDQYARASGDYNPIHVSQAFALYAGHDGKVIHGMYTSGVVRGLVELHIAENEPERIRSWSTSFKSKVSPGDILKVSINQTGMHDGHLMVSVTARNAETGVEVISATANILQKRTAYVFTGQGSQVPGMGMELYENSEEARNVWDTADRHFQDTYGFSIMDIVRRNPKELTVFFGGRRGRAIRENYLSLTLDVSDGHGNLSTVKAFPEITISSRSYTYKSEGGLLHETMFTQPAMAVLELARFQDMQARGIIDRSCCFAGHSLGEFMALASLGKIFKVEELATLVFYRGLAMQKAVSQSGEQVPIEYSMCAANPTRISPDFREKDLRLVVSAVARETGGLCEIVNLNVENMQYVCAGEVRCLDVLAGVLDYLVSHRIPLDTSATGTPAELKNVVQSALAKTMAKSLPLILERSKATIPLKVNVPFHSSLLRSGVGSFRRLLERSIPPHMVQPELLIGKYIPNLTARPFELSKAYCSDILALTESPRVKEMLDNWDRYTGVAA